MEVRSRVLLRRALLLILLVPLILISHKGPINSRLASRTEAALGYTDKRASASISSEHATIAWVRDDPALTISPSGQAEADYPWVFCIGDIFNLDALASELGMREPPSPAALIRQGIISEGLEFFSKVHGDAVTFTLTESGVMCARDKSGLRTVYYGMVNGKLLVSTDLHAIDRHEAVKTPLDEEFLAQYITRSLSSLDRTPYENVYRIPKGCYLDWRTAGPVVDRFWKLPAAHDTVSLDRKRERLRSLVRSAVSCRVPGSRKTAIMMSGGIDSTAVASCAGTLHDDVIEASYTVVFPEQDGIQERDKAQTVANSIGIPHYELQGSELDAVRFCRRAARDIKSPCIDSTLHLYDAVGKAAQKDNVSSVLTGLGGNLFDGSRLEYITEARFGSLKDILAQLSREEAGFRRSLSATVGAAIETLVPAQPTRLTSSSDISNFSLQSTSAFEWHRVLERQLYDPYMELALATLDSLGRYHGLRWRHPLLDSRIIEFLFTLPPNTCFRNGRYKTLFREAFAESLPSTIIEQSVQDNSYTEYVRGLLRDRQTTIEETISNGVIQSASPTRKIDGQAKMKAFFNERNGNHTFVWRLFTTELWLSQRDCSGPWE